MEPNRLSGTLHTQVCVCVCVCVCMCVSIMTGQRNLLYSPQSSAFKQVNVSNHTVE